MTITSTSTSAFFDRVALDLSSLRAQAEDLQGQISSSQRLSRSSDDPLAASRLRALERSSSLAEIDSAAGSRATADLNLADTALGQFADYVTRAKELATQAATATLPDSQRASIGQELQQIYGNMVALANTRDAAGHALFGGDAPGDAYALDAAGNASYVGNGAAGELSLGDGQAVARSFTGPEFLTFKDKTGGSQDLLALVKGLADTLQAGGAGTPAAARAALDTLGSGLEAITTAQTVVGTRLSWIDLNTERQTRMSEARQSEQAEVGATDVPSALVRLQELSTVLEASNASFAKLANLSLFDVLR